MLSIHYRSYVCIILMVNQGCVVKCSANTRAQSCAGPKYLHIKTRP